MPNPGDILKVGHWIYDGTIKCRVEIQFSNIRYGSGDHEDLPEWREDQPGEWCVVSYSSPIEPENAPLIGSSDKERQLSKKRCDVQRKFSSIVR